MRQILNVILCCFMTTVVFATSATPKLQITANSSTFNYATGENDYEGDVKVDYDTTHLRADRITTKNNDKNKIELATAYGINHLAEYSTIPKPGDPVFHAKAKIIKYYPQNSRVVLEGNVIVTQGKNSFHGPIIIYNTKEKTIIAPPHKGGRATFIIEPKQFRS